MKAISLKPAGTAKNFRILAVIPQFFTKFALHIGVMGAVVTLISAPLDEWAVAAPAAFVTLAAALHADKKGGNDARI